MTRTNNSKRNRTMVDSGHYHHHEGEDSNGENTVNDSQSGHHIHHHHHFHYYHHHHHHNESNDNEDRKPIVQLDHAPTSTPITTPQASFRIHCKFDSNYFLSIVDGSLILGPSNPDDNRQQWYKNDDSTRKHDETGQPAFALVNKATGQAIRHSFGSSLPVSLVTYRRPNVDETLLWMQGKDMLGYGGYKALIPHGINGRKCNLDADSYVRDGDQLATSYHGGGCYALWKITNC